MPDLIEKFFLEDLTESEEQSLEELLETSEEGAEKLVSIAEKNYYRYGFPTPRLPEGGTPPAGLRRGIKPWIILSIFIAAFMAALLYCKSAGIGSIKLPYFSGNTSEASTGRNESSGQKDSPVNSRVKTGLSENPLTANQQIDEEDGNTLSKESVVDGASGAADEKTVAFKPENRAPYETSLKTRIQPVVTPINLDESPSRKYSGVSVEITQSEPGFVAVRVLDMSGLEVRPLYSGKLEQGHWAFPWDGQLGKGKQAKPGYYQVEVRSGSFVGRKNILIK